MAQDEEPKNISRRNFMVRTAMGGAGLVIANELLSENLQAATPKTTNATKDDLLARPRTRWSSLRLGPQEMFSCRSCLSWLDYSATLEA